MSSLHLQFIADLVASTLWQALWQGIIVGLLVAVTLRVAPRASVRVRYAILCSGLVLTALGVVASLAASSSGPSGRFAAWIATVWAAGMVVLSVRVVGGWYVLRRVRHAPPAVIWQSTVTRLSHRLGVSRAVSVVESDRTEVAGLVGWSRPTIVLPSSTLSTATVCDVEAIVAHELSHVRRHDYAANLCQVIIETALFFHPAIWWLSRQVRVQREHCCDDLAAAVHDADPLSYAEALVRLERWRTLAGERTPSAWGGHLASRVRRLTEHSVPVAGEMSWWAPTALFNLAALSLFWAARTTGGFAAFVSVTWSHPSMDIGWTTLVFGAGLGLLLGMRHACEPDHLLAVSTLMSGERSAARATRLGVSWGLGHTCSLFAVDAVLAIVHVQLPTHVSEVFELGVSLMLIGLGTRAIAVARRQGTAGPSHVHTHGALTHHHRGVVDHVHVGGWSLARRPLLVGMVHGLAGSGALAALVMANLPTVPAQVGYIAVFGAGSTIGMAALSACAGWPLARFVQRPATIAALSCLSGALSIAYGVLAGSPLVWRWLS